MAEENRFKDTEKNKQPDLFKLTKSVNTRKIDDPLTLDQNLNTEIEPPQVLERELRDNHS